MKRFVKLLATGILLSTPLAVGLTNAQANGTPEPDEWIYCNEKFEWGERCFVKVQCHGYISGAVHVQRIAFPDESFLNVGWGFEYAPNNDPGLASFLCEGWDTLLRPKWNPKFDMKCKGPDVKEPKSMARVTADLSNCEFDWSQP